MGTWDDGLYDNDSALDELADLVQRADEGLDAAGLVAQIGLLTWLHPVSVTFRDGARELAATLDPGDLERLPEATREALYALVDDPEEATEDGSRSPAARAAIGGYSDGPRIDALLRFPGAQPTIVALGERAAIRLDRTLAPKQSLYEVAGGLASLGVLIELAEAGFYRPDVARVDRWRAAFDAIDRATKEERGFWWKYVRRVRRGFDLLAPPEDAGAPAKPTVRRRPAAPAKPEGPRFQHPKFGEGVLISRTGAGEAETLELRFADGSVRRILARFLTPVAE